LSMMIKKIDAVVINLEIIGEAAKKLPDEIINRLPQIEWDKIRGLRNILAHQYFGINNKIIWDVVENKLAQLRDACSSILK